MRPCASELHLAAEWYRQTAPEDILGLPAPLEVVKVNPFQRDTGLPALRVEVGAVGQLAGRPGGGGPAVEPRLQGFIGQGPDLGPVEPGVARLAEDRSRH